MARFEWFENYKGAEDGTVSHFISPHPVSLQVAFPNGVLLL